MWLFFQFMRRDLYDFNEAGDEDVDDISAVKPQKNNKVSFWPRGYETFFILNSTEHEISTAHKN